MIVSCLCNTGSFLTTTIWGFHTLNKNWDPPPPALCYIWPDKWGLVPLVQILKAVLTSHFKLLFSLFIPRRYFFCPLVLPLVSRTFIFFKTRITIDIILFLYTEGNLLNTYLSGISHKNKLKGISMKNNDWKLLSSQCFWFSCWVKLCWPVFCLVCGDIS